MTDDHGKTTTGSAINVRPPANTDYCATAQRSVNQDDFMFAWLAFVPAGIRGLEDKTTTKPIEDTTVVPTITTSVDAQNFQNKIPTTVLLHRGLSTKIISWFLVWPSFLGLGTSRPRLLNPQRTP